MTSEGAARDADNVTPAAPSLGFRAHQHLWALFDGTPAHAPPGRVVRDNDGHIACHLCGKWFTHLGPHLRTHGWTATRYRTAVGLDPVDSLDGTAPAKPTSARNWEVWQRPQGRRSTRVAGP